MADIYQTSGMGLVEITLGTLLLPQHTRYRTNFYYKYPQGINGYGDEQAFESMVDALQDPDNLGFLREDSFLGDYCQ
ncbi:MAG: hypothetical protein R2827_02035 [Bdellovibrionales bacterium]